MIWTKGGKVIVDASGNVLECEVCPCDETPPLCLDTETITFTFAGFTSLGVIDSEEFLVNTLNGPHTLTGGPDWNIVIDDALTYRAYIDNEVDPESVVNIDVQVGVVCLDGVYSAFVYSSNEGPTAIEYPGLALDTPFAIDWGGNSPSSTRLMSAGTGAISA